MGLFWDYFLNTLRLPFIAKPGPLAMLAEGGAESKDATRDVVISLRDQFLPVRCEEQYLTNFANSRGIVRSPLEPLEHWLARVKFAYHWWSRGGRASAMSEALELSFGFSAVQIQSLRAEDPARWASFRVLLEGGSGDVLTQTEQITWSVNEVKPARSKLERLKIFMPANLTVRVGAATMIGQNMTVYPRMTTLLSQQGSIQFAAACQSVETVTLYPLPAT